MEASYPPDDRHPTHSHERASFCLVLEGGFAASSRNTSVVCNPSSVLFYPAGEAHAEHFQPAGGRCLILEVESARLDRPEGPPLALDCPADFHGGSVAGIAFRLYRELRTMDDASPLAIEGLALELLAEAFRSLRRPAGRTPTRRLEDARELLRAHFPEQISLSVVAGVAGLHPIYFAQEFRKAYGCSVGEYVRRLRVEFASRELSGTDAPLSRIAVEAGFFDQSHFTRTFKRLTGMTPAEYRAASRPH
jgi:AraC family transcriptional regulator